MPPPVLPAPLVAPTVHDGHVTSKVLLDLTVYLTEPTEDELAFLIESYRQLCPRGRITNYKIAELPDWKRTDRPVLTRSGRTALAKGVRDPEFEPVRQRIRDGRSFQLRLWDGLPIDDPSGSWSFTCSRIHLEDTGLHAVARTLTPLETEPELLHWAAIRLADQVEFSSGHGGLTFTYNPWLKFRAFRDIYAKARRWWGVDIEDLNATLPLVRDRIKGVNWLTLLGRRLIQTAEGEEGIGKLASAADVRIEAGARGAVVVAGPHPVSGDQNRPDRSLEPYFAVAKALEPLFLDGHPDFPGEPFVQNLNTMGWIRRFLDPTGWR